MGLDVKKLNITAAMKGGASSAIVSDLSFSVERGERLAIVGQSGCGKTMTAMGILGLLPENCRASGEILWNGRNLLSMQGRQRRRLLGVEHVLIPQSGADFLNSSLTIKRQISETLARNGVEKYMYAGLMEALLERVGFQDPQKILRSYPFQLSGGMAQRVVMAIASAGSPGLVIADEPTKGIDQDNTQQFVDNLDTLFPDAAVIIITHDISIAAICHNILVMRDGTVEEFGEACQVLKHPANPYTHQLICDLPHALAHVDRGIV